MEFELRKPKNINKYISTENKKFMAINDNDIASRDVLLAEIEKKQIKTKGEFIRFCQKNGFLKTERDRIVVKDVIRKAGLKEDFLEDRKNIEKEINEKRNFNKLMGKKIYNDI